MTTSSGPTIHIAFFPGFLSAVGGGMVRSACVQAKALAFRGMTVRIEGLCSDAHPAALDEFATGRCEVLVHEATHPGPSGRSAGLLESVRRHVHSLDLVHLNGCYNVLNYRIADICRRAGVPYIISARATLNPATLALQPASLLKRLEPFERQYVRGAAAIHCTSRSELRHVETIDGVPQRLLIPNAVALGDLIELPAKSQARPHLGIPEHQFAMLFLGRLVPEKQPEFLLEVLTRVDPALAPFLYFVGDATPAARHAMQARARELDVLDRIALVPHANLTVRSNWLAAADVFLLPSVFENFSLALVESVAAGLPAVVSPDIGATDYLEAGDYTALAVEPVGWARRVEAAAAEARRRNLDREAFGRLYSLLSPARIAHDWLRAYDDLGIRKVTRTSPVTTQN